MLAYYYLGKLKFEWDRYVHHHEWKKKHVEQKSVGLLERAAFRLFELKLEYELWDSVSRNISQIQEDWCFLDMFVRSMVEWSDADKLMRSEGRGALVSKVGVLSDEIEKVIKDCGYGKKYLRRPEKLLGLLGDCRRKTDELLEAEENGEALEHLLSNVAFEAYCCYDSDWLRFVESVGRNLLSIKDVVGDGCLNKRVYVLYVELGLIRGYFLGGQNQSMRFNRLKVKDHTTFLRHIASVVVKIAHQSFDFWINRNDTEIAKVKATKLVGLQHQIDPTNTVFMKSFLGFQLVVLRDATVRCLAAFSTADCVANFCDYLLPNSSSSWDKNHLKQELTSLVNVYFPSRLHQHHSSREDVSCLFAEVDAVFGKIAILHHAVRQGNETDHLNTCSELLTQVRLLNLELLIKEKLSPPTSSIVLAEDNDRVLTLDKNTRDISQLVSDLCPQKDTEYGRQYLLLAEELKDMVQSLIRSIGSKKMTKSLGKHSHHQLLYKILFSKAETVLAELLKKSQSDNSLIACVKDQIESLVEELQDFKRLVTSQLMLNSPEEGTIFILIEEVARRITLISYSILSDNDEEIFLSLPLLLDKGKHIRATLRKIFPPSALCNFPKTFMVGFIDFFCSKINELLKYNPVSIAPVKLRLKQVQLHLESLRTFLVKVADSAVEKGHLNGFVNQIRDTAHKLEYVVESIEVHSHSKYFFWLHDLLDEIAFVNQQVSKVPEISCAVKFKNPPGDSREIISQDPTSAINEMMVDLVDEENLIINLLMRGSSQRDIVSIIGMPGIGKTTLAMKVYNAQNVLLHFPRRAWCTVSQVYSKRELLLDILTDLHGITDEIHQMTDEDLQSKLRRCLLRNKYLIILDDVWDIAAWNDLEISFPDDSNGSRILITSRLRDVHSKIKSGSGPHLIRLFSDEESWMLLEKKIFKGVGCPRELLLVGEQIAQHCQGLPLAVVAIAGLLQKTEKTQGWWEKISESLSSKLINDLDPENRCKEILEMSYKHLPEYLKVCFLYLGVFLKDKDIPVSKLTQFWMAEGFIQETQTKSLEDVAQDYLMELINRSLVIISKTRSNGKVKACRLHDLLRDLCHSKAKDENFLHLVTRYDEPYASFAASEYDFEFHNAYKLYPVTFEDYRLSIYLRRNHFIDSAPSGPRTRSLIFFPFVDKEPRCPYEISFICNNFKLLRVLDLESINMGVSFPVEIGLMVQLRYLAVSGYVRSIPPSIANLWKLQTLVVKGFRGTVILPNTIWSMANLRHLHVNEHVSFNLQDDDEQVGNSILLDNLVSFSTPSLSCVDNTINILRRLPNLLKMKCIFLESWDSSKSCNRFPVLEFLTRLESLKIIYYGGAINSGEFILPLGLKKLTLSKFRLPWNHVSRIGGLPNLRVLKLLSGAFEGPKWEMNEEEFRELEFLKLDALNIAEWNANYDHLPNLKRLVLRNCNALEEIPKDFAYINTLEMIEVQWCGKSVEESAKRIGNEIKEIKVVITYN